MYIQHNINLKAFNTFGVDAYATDFLCLNDEAELDLTIAEINKAHPNFMILGGGSNILITQKVVNRLIIHMQLRGIKLVKETDADLEVAVSAGENWHDFVSLSLEKSWFGLENLALIPGSVGAAPVQNIGAYGAEVGKFISKVRCFDLFEQKMIELSAADCHFSYRHSIFKTQPQRYIILTVVFKLFKKFKPNLNYKILLDYIENKDNITAKSLYDAVVTIRQSKIPNPKLLGNAGSFFQNPIVDIKCYQRLLLEYPNLVSFPSNDHEKVKLSAGQLIELSGLKGLKKNQVGMYEKQALILVNYGNATGEEIWEYAQFVQKDIYNKFIVELVAEPFII